MSTKTEAVIFLTAASALLLGSAATYAQTGNAAYGPGALISNTTGDYNAAFGSNALRLNTAGSNNTATGSDSLYYNTGSYNTGSGAGALATNSTGFYNTASGTSSLSYNTTGNYNVANGNFTLYSNTIGNENTALGYNTLYSNTTASGNAALGAWSMYSNTTGSSNVFIGRSAGYYETGSNKLYIAGNTIRPLLYGVFSETASANRLGIGQNTVPADDTIAAWNGAHLTTGGVWTNASSRELKDDIKPLSTDDANRTLAQLSPVQYVYKNSPDEHYVGFIAEDVPELVASNDRKSLSPMDIVAVLTTVTKEQKDEIRAQKSEITALRSALDKQEQRMQKMEIALAELKHQ